MKFTLQAVGVAGGLALISILSSDALMGQGAPAPTGKTYAVPRTPWGEPDLQGIYNGNDLQGVPMQRAETVGTRELLNDDEYRQRIANRDNLLASDNDSFDIEESEKFERFGAVGGPVSPPPHWLERAKNVSRIASFVVEPANGRIPALTAQAQAEAQKRQQAAQARRKQLGAIEAEWTTDRSNYDRCISLGTLNSVTPKIYNSGSRIVQGPGWVAFTNEMIHETRVIPTDGRSNVSGQIQSWMGNSVGRWEGDTLVVTTKNLKAESAINGQPLSPEGVITERFTLADADTLDYRMTVNDPRTYTAQWTMRMPIPRDDGYGLYEYACHEGNYTMFNILSGARAAERAPK